MHKKKDSKPHDSRAANLQKGEQHLRQILGASHQLCVAAAKWGTYIKRRLT